MADRAFSLFRNEVIKSLNAHGVAYKIFGGAVVQLIESSRGTEDIDMFVLNTELNVDNLVKALVFCKFGEYQDLREQINTNVNDGYETFQLVSTNPRWKDFWLDISFSIGKYTYDSTPQEIHHISTGLQINIVGLRYVAEMKANIQPQPRQKDIDDIGIISDYLGLDPATGKPKVTNERKRK